MHRLMGLGRMGATKRHEMAQLLICWHCCIGFWRSTEKPCLALCVSEISMRGGLFILVESDCQATSCRVNGRGKRLGWDMEDTWRIGRHDRWPWIVYCVYGKTGTRGGGYGKGCPVGPFVMTDALDGRLKG